jgi:hypothetical protein
MNPIKSPREMMLEMAGIPSMAAGRLVGKDMLEQVAKAIARYKKAYGKAPPEADVQELKKHVMSLSRPSSTLRTGPQAEARAFHELATDPNLMFPAGPDPFLTKAMTGRTVKGTYLKPKVQDINDPNVMQNIERAQEAGTLEAIPVEGQASITPSADYMARMAQGIENAKLSAGKTPLIDKLKQDFFSRHKRFPTDEELDMIIAEFNPSRHQYGELGQAIVGERPATARGMADWKQRARTEGIEERYLERPPSEYPQYLKDELMLLQGEVPKKADGRSVRDMEAELAMANRAPKKMRGYQQTLQAAKDFMSGMRDAPMQTAKGYMDLGEMAGMYTPKQSEETYMSAPQGRFIPQLDTQRGGYQTGVNVASLIGDPFNYLFALPYGRMARAAGQASKGRQAAGGLGLAAAPSAIGSGGYRSVMEDYK